MTDEEYEEKFPEINWRNPIRINVIDNGWGYACRLCVAHFGFKAADVDKLYKTDEEFNEHQAQFHPRNVAV